MKGNETYGKFGYIPQELLQEISKIGNRLLIGLPCERHEDEKRIVLTPEAVNVLTECGHHVRLESGAGRDINYSDNHYSEAGAEIVATPEEVYQSDVILKMLPPLPAEAALMKSRSLLLSMVQFNLFAPETYMLMMNKRITALGYEFMEDEVGQFPVLNAISEIEGATAVTIASDLLSNTQGGKGILLGGVPGVSPTEVVIIGAGCAGTVAARAALSLGASVKVFDDDVSKLRNIQQVLGQGLFTSTYHPNVLHNAFRTADVVIGAIRSIRARHHYIMSDELIRSMKRGSLLIDLRVSQGGCFETTSGLTLNDATVFEKYGVLHYCVPNVSNRVARTTSMAISNLIVPLMQSLGNAGSVQATIKSYPVFRNAVYMYCGKPVKNCVSNRFNLPSNELDLYLSAF